MVARFTIFFLVFCFLGCASHKPQIKSPLDADKPDVQQLVNASRDAALLALKEKQRGKIKHLAKQGEEYAKRCMDLAPQEAGCYYWHAVNTGIYYRVQIIGYQRGIKRMISDCEKVINLDPKYDEAGAFRMLGEIYTRLPQTGGTIDSIVRDLSLAEENLNKAVDLAPNYPENYLALSETLLELEKVPDAEKALTKAIELSPKWKDDVSYAEWQKNIRKFKKQIAKAKK